MFTFFASAQNKVLFDAGNKAYNESNFQEAISAYERILDSGVHSTELYFNLANAYYKLNRIAPSIYYYEKALQLSPNDKEIKSNLAFAQNMTIDAIEVIPEVGLSKIFKGFVNTFSFDVWALISVILVIVFVLLFLGYYFSQATAKKRLAFVVSSGSLIVAVVALFFAFQKFEYDRKDQPAIVFAQESEVKTDPNLRSEIAFVLHEGTKVQVLEHYQENWTKIKLSDGKTGWIPNIDIKSL
ncbi:tetratricopeptide repeat protein [Flavobacteriaceae sp. LMIT009]